MKDSLALWTLDSRSIDPTLLFMGPLMSTTTTPRRTGPTIPGETRICIPGVNWRFYEWLVDSIPEGTGVRVAFDGTDVEIMTTSPEHEDFKELLPRQESSACCCILTRRASEGNAPDPSLARRVGI